jgi:cytidyltransferase-like protein
MSRIYVCVTADLMHPGHISFFEKAKAFGSTLVVGVCADEEVSSYKRTPILNLADRSLMVSSCRMVDEVISPAPAITTKSLIEKFSIDLVVVTSDYSEITLKNYFSDPKSMGILKFVPYDTTISTTQIISKCYDQYVKCNGQLGSLS